MTLRFRTAAVLALLVLAIVGGAYAWFWHRVADDIRAGLPAWAAGLAADGLRIAHGPATVSGFPLWFRIELPTPVLERVGAYPSARWTGRRLVGAARPWRLAHWTIAAPEPSRLDLMAGRDRWRATVATVDGSFTGGAGGGVLSLVARGVTGSEPDPLAIAAIRLRLAPEPGRPAALAVALGAEGIRLPATPDPLFGRDVATVAGEGVVVERIPRLPPAAALDAWRSAGGNVDVTRFRLVWGEVRADGAFTLALDRSLQPVLAGTAELAGHEAVLDALVATGRLGRMEAFGLRALLGALARPAPEGGQSVAAQFAVQDGALSAGPVRGGTFRLLSLPRIAWPER